MEEKTTLDKIKEIEEKEKINQDKQNSLWKEAEDLRKAKANLILQHFKEKKIFSLMTWIYNEEWGGKIRFQAKEDWNKCPKELISLLSPDYHDHFYFWEHEEGIDPIEAGVKMGLHFSDGDICMTLEIVGDDRNKMIDFLKRYAMKIDTEEIELEIEDDKKKIEGKEKIIEFSKKINGK